MKQLRDWLNRPYPMIETNQERFSLALTLGLVVGIVLLIFQPFGIRDIDQIKFLCVSGFGVVTTLSTLTLLYITYLLQIMRLISSKWTVAKQFIFWNSLITVITLGNWALNVSISEAIMIKEHSLLDFVVITLAVGIVPLIVSIFFSEKNLRKRNSITAETLNKELKTNHTKNEDLPVSTAQFLYAKTEGNYVQIFASQGEPTLIRITMRDLEALYIDEPQITRCHRSYMVNLQSVTTVKGNASGLILPLSNSSSIPVSRAYVENIRGLLINLV